MDTTVGKQRPEAAESDPQPPQVAPPRNSLALLALLTSAVVVTTRGSDYFNLWDSMIGLIIVTVASAYRHEVGVDRAYRTAFALIVGAGLMLIVGPVVESVLYLLYPTINSDGPLLHTPGTMIYDSVFVGLWAVLAFLVYTMLARRQDR